MTKLRATDALGAQSWLLWLPASSVEGQGEIESWAWQEGAQDILRETDPDQFWQRQLIATQGRLSSARGAAQQLTFLRSTLDSLQASVDNIPAPIFLKDVDGRYTGCNRAFCDFLGRSREGIIGKTVYDIAPPELAVVYHRADQQLLAEGRRQIYDAQVRWSDGTLRDVTFFKAVFHDLDGSPAGQAGAIFDITDRRELEQRLRALAARDALTGLHNRRAFFDEGDSLLEAASNLNEDWLVVMIDVDHFKLVNDGLGHAAGDALLKHIAAELRSQLRAGDLIARLGGDEFAILLRGDDQARSVLERLALGISAKPLASNGQEIRASISLGATSVRGGDMKLEFALNLADKALYEAKRLGRNRTILINGAPQGNADA